MYMIKLHFESKHCPDIVLDLQTKVKTLTESDDITLYTTDPLSPIDVKYLCYTRKDLEFISHTKDNEIYTINLKYHHT